MLRRTAQIKGDELGLLPHTGIMGTEVVLEPDIMLEPPEGGRSEDDETCSIVPEAFAFPDRRFIVRWESPIFPVLLQKRNRSPTGRAGQGR